MSKLIEFLEREEANKNTPPPDEQPPVESKDNIEPSVQDPTDEEPVVPPVVVEQDPVPLVEPPVQDPVIKDEGIEDKVTAKKLKVDYKDFIEQNKEVIKRYLNDSSTDYSSMDNLEVLKLKIKNDNPDFTPQQVKDELEDKYFLDLKDKDIDDLSSEEQNNLKKGERLLISDARKAKEELNSLRATAESLPEFELELAVESEPVPVAEVFNEEAYVTQTQEQNQKLKEEVWIPTLKNTLSEIETLTETIPYEDGNFKGEIKVNYKLSDAEKQEVLDHLSEYVANPSDNKYIKEDGSVDYKGFVADKAKELNFSKILKTAVKEARASAREDFIERDLVNYSEEVRNVAPTEVIADEMDFFRIKSGKKV